MAYHLHSHYVLFACGRSCGVDKLCVACPGGISGRESSADLVVIPDHFCCCVTGTRPYLDRRRKLVIGYRCQWVDMEFVQYLGTV